MPDDTSLSPPAGLTVRDVARRYRVSPDKVRSWIRRGELRALNTSRRRCGRPRFVILPHHLAEFERARAATPTPKLALRKKKSLAIDFYPDSKGDG
jgi:excisionase family DNA binding protein